MIELNRIEELFDNQQFSLHELVLNELGVYVFVKNRRGEYLYANPLTLKLFETDAQSLFGKTDHDFFMMINSVIFWRPINRCLKLVSRLSMKNEPSPNPMVWFGFIAQSNTLSCTE